MDQALRVDTSFYSQWDHRFLLILFASIGAHVVVATWVARQPAPLQETELETSVDRFLRASPLLPIPKAKVQLAPTAARAPAPKAQPTVSRSTGPSRAGATDGLLGLVGAFREDLGKDDVAGILSGAAHGAVDMNNLGTRRDSDGPRQLQGIGAVETTGPGKVSLSEHADTHPTGHVNDLRIEEFPPEFPNPDLLQHFIASHRPALLSCYEQGLKHHGTLKGRLTVRFTLTPLGRASDISIADDSLGSAEVSDCITATVRRWVFPVRPESESPVQFPVLFTPVE